MAGTNGTHNGHAGEQLVVSGMKGAGIPRDPGPGTSRRAVVPTMATCSNGARMLEGTVEAVNERGVKVGGRWLNYSKWAGDIAEPRRGQVVALTLAGSGFVRAVGPADAAWG